VKKAEYEYAYEYEYEQKHEEAQADRTFEKRYQHQCSKKQNTKN